MAYEPPVNPFTISEIGEPGALRAVADFTCPRCGAHTRFHVRDEDPEGGFTCPHCELGIQIEGVRLSDYQRRLDSLDAGLGEFADSVRQRLTAAAERMVTEAEAAEGREPPTAPLGEHRDEGEGSG
ncbi:MAG: hypothetical protein MI919_10920 [Holophagales bacterium]|nr:hypothetical protein [Holophagales bacterium]